MIKTGNIIRCVQDMEEYDLKVGDITAAAAVYELADNELYVGIIKDGRMLILAANRFEVIPDEELNGMEFAGG